MAVPKRWLLGSDLSRDEPALRPEPEPESVVVFGPLRFVAARRPHFIMTSQIPIVPYLYSRRPRPSLANFPSRQPQPAPRALLSPSPSQSAASNRIHTRALVPTESPLPWLFAAFLWCGFSLARMHPMITPFAYPIANHSSGAGLGLSAYSDPLRPFRGSVGR